MSYQRMLAVGARVMAPCSGKIGTPIGYAPGVIMPRHTGVIAEPDPNCCDKKWDVDRQPAPTRDALGLYMVRFADDATGLVVFAHESELRTVDDRLVAAHVDRPATLAVRSPHASANELATAIGGAS